MNTNNQQKKEYGIKKINLKGERAHRSSAV